jgi:PAS domain S-box-containing protein
MDYIPRNFKTYIRLTSFLTVSLGITVIFGWLFNIPVLKSIIQGYISMKFNTALCLIFMGLALFYLTSEKNNFHKKLSILLVVPVFIVAVLSLSQDLLHIDWGLDELFMRDIEKNASQQVYPGRMSPITAFCFILISWVLLTAEIKKTQLQVINQNFLHACTVLSFIAILGYVFNTSAFYRFTFLTSMALHTAIAIFMFSTSASLLNPTLGITGLLTGRQVGNVLARRLFSQILVASVILGYLRFLSHKYNYIDVYFGIALFTFCFILMSLFLILRASNELNTMHLKKTKAEHNLSLISMFLDSTPDPIIIVNDKGIIEMMNNQTEAVFGYTKGELYGKEIEVLMPNRFQHIHEKHRADFSMRPKIRDMGTDLELFAIKKNGAEFPVEISLSPIRLETATWVSAAIRDISIRKEEEHKLSQLATIIENSADAIISKKLDGTILTWNKGAEKILGYKFEEVLGKNISFLFPPERLAEERIIMHKILKGDFINQYETIRIRKDQTPIYVSITLSPIKDKNGKIMGVSKILRDITKNKEQEENSRKYAILESKSKEMEQFAYIASHDLREPLLTIKNYMKLFLKNFGDALDEESKQYIESIVRASNRMDVLIKDLLDYSRLSQLKKLQEVDTSILVKEIESDLFFLISSNNAVITVEKLPIIKAYPTELKILFQNLIANAIKFKKKDTTPQIHISCSKTGSVWEFEIKDNGIGIADEDKEKVFHMFKRLHSRQEYEGTGIGLAYCKKIVELHNGNIHIVSKPGVGSSFKFTIST